MKKTKFDKSAQNITFKLDTCLNSGENLKTPAFRFRVDESTFKLTEVFENNKVKPWSRDWLIAAGAYPGCCSMKRPEVFLLPLDGMLVHHRSLPRPSWWREAL